MQVDIMWNGHDQEMAQTVLETAECFLSNTNNNMHILATETEEQAFYSGHVWAPFIHATQYCPCSHKKLWQVGCLQADFCRQSDSVSSDTLVRLTSGLSEQCVRSSAAWQVIFWRMHVSTFTSPEHIGESQ